MFTLFLCGRIRSATLSLSLSRFPSLLPTLSLSHPSLLLSTLHSLYPSLSPYLPSSHSISPLSPSLYTSTKLLLSITVIVRINISSPSLSPPPSSPLSLAPSLHVLKTRFYIKFNSNFEYVNNLLELLWTVPIHSFKVNRRPRSLRNIIFIRREENFHLNEHKVMNITIKKSSLNLSSYISLVSWRCMMCYWLTSTVTTVYEPWDCCPAFEIKFWKKYSPISSICKLSSEFSC